MSRSWNGKALLDNLGERVWNTQTAYRSKLIRWINEIQDDIVSEIPMDYFLFKTKKLVPIESEIIDLNPQIPSAPSAIIATNEIFRAKYGTDASADADTAASDVAGTLVGSATVLNGVLNLPVTSDSYASYNGENATWAENGTIRFKWTPQFSGAPASSYYLFSYADAENDINNLIRLFIPSGTQVIRWDIYDSSGSVIKTVQSGNTITGGIVSGTTYEIEFSFDVTLGEYRLFIDGAEINGLQTSAGSHTRTDEAGAIIRVGRNYTASADSGINSLIDDVQLFNIVQHTESFTGEVPRTLPASPSTYRVLTTFVIYEPNLTRYIESSGGLKSSPVVVDLSSEMISVSNIDTMDGNTAVNPSVIYRKIYLEKKASGETSYGEPFFLCDIIDNTTTTLNITADPTSTITPPSVSELDQLSSKQMVFSGSAQYLEKVNQAYVQRFDSNGSESTSPDFFDYLGTDSIYL